MNGRGASDRTDLSDRTDRTDPTRRAPHATEDYIYSVRMRASMGGAHEDGGRHVSGAERLVDAADVPRITSELTERALNRKSETDFIRVTVDRIPRGEVATAQVLRLNLTSFESPEQSIDAAISLLNAEGITRRAAMTAFDILTNGLNDGAGPLRGALLFTTDGVNATPDGRRGIRASRFDYAPGQSASIEATLATERLSHFRTREALALATKVIWSGVVAELCWSDEPDYAAGYVSTRTLGYVRFPHFKSAGAVGGRIFFIDGAVNALIENLERKALWITGPLDVVEFTPPGGAV